MVKYEAVNRKQLVERLGGQCSPDWRRDGYVIGPDVNGRLCHVASCFFYCEAVSLANRLNKEAE